MALLSLQGALLLVSLLLLIGQLFVQQKRGIHVVFAIFCGSIAMMAAKQLGDEQLGAYQYLIGMGTCATCNGIWLVSRALFREHGALSVRHILVAGTLGLMIITGQALGLAQSVTQNDIALLQSSRVALYAVLNLLSSCVLVLSAWEACRGLGQAQGQQLWQRLLFLASYCSAILLCTILITNNSSEQFQQGLSAACAIQMLLVIQVLIYWRFHHAPITPKKLNIAEVNSAKAMPCCAKDNDNSSQAETALAKQIQTILEDHKMYLQTNLKVADLARKMNVSEYRISRVFRHHFNARNFNHFINDMRIKHAKALLEDPKNTQWPILVIGLESGFASVGPFTRAFKSICDMTPNQYRQFHHSASKQPVENVISH